MSNITTIGDHLTALEGRIIDANTAQRIEIESLEAARTQALAEIQQQATLEASRIHVMFDTLIANRRKLIAELDGLRMEPEPMQQAAE